jgi:hypothetical protein
MFSFRNSFRHMVLRHFMNYSNELSGQLACEVNLDIQRSNRWA